MKKKGAFIAVLLAGVMSLGVSAAGCKKKDNGDEGVHTHTWGAYISDGESGHYRVSTCGDHEPIEEAHSAHEYDGVDDATCNKCDYVRETGGEVVPVTGVSISGSSTVQAGKVIALTAEITPATATNKTVVWQITEGASFAEIDSETGMLKGLAAGKVTVKATADGVSGVKEITVTAASSTDVPVTYVTLSQTSAELTVGGADVRLKATVSPENATDKTVLWSSDNTAVATVADGVIHAVAVGTANITVVTEDGGFKAVCAVTVKASGVPENPETPATKYTVKFISDGVTVDTQEVEHGGVVAAPPVSKEGSYFGGWFENSACTGSAYDFGKGITGEKTFYVKWIVLDAKITYSYAGKEAAAFEWSDTNAAGASVQYKLSSQSTYVDVDEELIRSVDGSTLRVDVLGLKGGEAYDFKITTSAGTDIQVNEMAINSYDRSGYAHFNYTDGVGAYNDDGTLKDNALVIYVTEENKDTVMDGVCKENSDVNMFTIPYSGYGKDWKGKNASGIGWWLNNNQYTSNNAGSNNNKRPSNTYDAVNGGKLGFKSVNRPVVVRFIGKVTTPEGCSALDEDEGGINGDNGHMARMKNLKNITLEGVGEDAEINGWGFHFIAGTDAAAGQGKSFEVRNLTFNAYPEDAVGMEGQQSGDKITAGVERCWIHNNTFLPGFCANPKESDKKEGDGSCDFKRGQYFTASYNYFEYCHKTNLVGSSDSSLQYNMTFHHNMWYQCGSRIPLTRQANVHFYNNYVCYDATETSTPYSHIAKPAGSYVHSLRANCYIFSEGNYYEGSKNVTDKTGGSAKGWNNMYYANFGTNNIVNATSREQKVANNCKYNGTDYSTFDTNPAVFYYDAVNKRSDCSVTDAATARREVIENVGVQGFTPRVKVDMLEKKPETAVSVPKDGLTIDLSKASVGGNVSGVYFINAKNSSGAAKGKGQLAMFTLAERTDITVSVTGSGDSIGELLRADGAVIAGKFTSYTGTLEAGTYFIASGQKDKDAAITALSFKSGVTDSEKVKNVINYIDAIGTVEYTEACREKIEMAKAAYNALSSDLKSQVTNAAKLASAETAYNSLAAAPVIDLINAIGTVNEDSGIKITAAKAAYNALTAEQKALVTNFAVLTAAEQTYKNYEVIGINKQIAALDAPETAVTEAGIRALLERYEAINQMYADLGEEQKPKVVGMDKVSAGIAALEKALKPYEVKALIANLPEQSHADYYAKVGALKTAYEALDAQQKAMLTASEKAAYDAAIEKYTEYLSQAKVAIFDKNKPNLATDAGFTITGSVGYKGTSQTFMYNGVEYNSPLKVQSSNTILFSTETKMKVTIFLHSGGSQKLIVDGKEFTATDGFIVTEVEAGSHEITRSGEAWLCYVELVPAS